MPHLPASGDPTLARSPPALSPAPSMARGGASGPALWVSEREREGIVTCVSYSLHRSRCCTTQPLHYFHSLYRSHHITTLAPQVTLHKLHRSTLVVTHGVGEWGPSLTTQAGSALVHHRPHAPPPSPALPPSPACSPHLSDYFFQVTSPSCLLHLSTYLTFPPTSPYFHLVIQC